MHERGAVASTVAEVAAERLHGEQPAACMLATMATTHWFGSPFSSSESPDSEPEDDELRVEVLFRPPMPVAAVAGQAAEGGGCAPARRSAEAHRTPGGAGKAAFGKSAKPLATLKACKGWDQRWRD